MPCFHYRSNYCDNISTFCSLVRMYSLYFTIFVVNSISRNNIDLFKFHYAVSI
jgi:hypothetical protein